MLTVRVDDRIRLTSSVMCLTERFGAMQSWAHAHPLRIATQNFLAYFKNHPSVRFYEALAKHHFMDTFYNLSLLCTAPPDIRWKHEKAPTLPDDYPFGEKTIRDFPKLTSKFYADAEISSLWQERKAEWDLIVDQCKEILSSYELAGWLQGFYGETQLDLVLVPNPTDPCGQGFGPSTKKEKYAVVGPVCISKQKEVSCDDFSYGNDPSYVVQMAFHEFSHGILGGSIKGNKYLIENTEYLSARNRLRGYFPSSYSTWALQLEEILIRACTALFISDKEGETNAKAFLDNEKRNTASF